MLCSKILSNAVLYRPGRAEKIMTNKFKDIYNEIDVFDRLWTATSWDTMSSTTFTSLF